MEARDRVEGRAEAILGEAREQVDDDLVHLPVRDRIRVYLGGAPACDCWVAERTAWILAERLVRAEA